MKKSLTKHSYYSKINKLFREKANAAIAQSVERILGKDEVASSNLASSSNLILYAAIAQPVERILGKDEVASSNLASSSKASEIFEFQRFSFAVVKIQLQKVQNRQFCENH